MGSDLRYNLINSFNSIDRWRANIVFNMFGSITPGFKRRDIFMGVKNSDVLLTSGRAQNAFSGSMAGATAQNSELVVNGYKITATNATPTREQGSNAVATHLSIQGDGFFAVAESQAPGARVFFTRNGSFHWKKVGEVKMSDGRSVPRYFLVNEQGLMVLRAKDIDTSSGQPRVKGSNDPGNPAGMYMSKHWQRDGYFADAAQTIPGRISGLLGETRQGDISKLSDAELTRYHRELADHDSDLAIVKIPAAGNLIASSYGGTVYEAPLSARAGIAAHSLRDWFNASKANPDTHVLPYSLEYLDSRALLDQLNVENENANFVYRNLSTFLQDYNKGIDDLFGIIR